MTRCHYLEPVFVDAIPGDLVDGRLYISKRYRTIVHRCCCGCGLEVVTPLNPAKWRLTEDGTTVSLHPSVGNWSFPCQSHYWIDRNHVRWAGAMPQWKINQVRHRDQSAMEALTMSRPQANVSVTSVERRSGWWSRLVRRIVGR